MLRSLFFVALLALITSCASQLPESTATLNAGAASETYNISYDRSALQNLKWLTGDWKSKSAGRVNTLSFLFHTPNMLEATPVEDGNPKPSQFFSWKDGRYYYGQNRQWVVSWISEKNIRFDPVVPGLAPMTWSRVNEDKWHLLRHSEKGDEVIVMQRIDEMNT